MNKDSLPVQRLPKVTDGFHIRVAYSAFLDLGKCTAALSATCVLHFPRAEPPLAGAKFG